MVGNQPTRRTEESVMSGGMNQPLVMPAGASAGVVSGIFTGLSLLIACLIASWVDYLALSNG